VKLLDAYLSKIKVQRMSLQLVGATSMLIAAKYDVSEIVIDHYDIHYGPDNPNFGNPLIESKENVIKCFCF
jgi:hypothetical protein